MPNMSKMPTYLLTLTKILLASKVQWYKNELQFIDPFEHPPCLVALDHAVPFVRSICM